MRADIEGVAFDLDGTLYPNYRMNIRLIPFILKEWRLVIAFGRARNIIREEQETNLLPPDSFYQRQSVLAAKILCAPQELIMEKINRLIYDGWEPLFKTIRLFRRVEETLAALQKGGYKLGLLSDFPPEKKLENLGISGIWNAVICSERCGVLKPHPLPFAKLAGAMDMPPEKILYVGNSRPYDVAGAQKAGMKTAWIKSPLFPGRGLKKPLPDFVFSDYRQLYDFMLN
jgi:putative hydrolase of the HAD superfamily